MTGVFYTGRTADGSDMKRVEGVYINPHNPSEWSSQPWPDVTRRERRKQSRQLIKNQVWV